MNSKNSMPLGSFSGFIVEIKTEIKKIHDNPKYRMHFECDQRRFLLLLHQHAFPYHLEIKFYLTLGRGPYNAHSLLFQIKLLINVAGQVARMIIQNYSLKPFSSIKISYCMTIIMLSMIYNINLTQSNCFYQLIQYLPNKLILF